MRTVLSNDVMSKIECGQLLSERFGRRHSTLQSHGLFALAKHLFRLERKSEGVTDGENGDNENYKPVCIKWDESEGGDQDEDDDGEMKQEADSSDGMMIYVGVINMVFNGSHKAFGIEFYSSERKNATLSDCVSLRRNKQSQILWTVPRACLYRTNGFKFTAS